MFAKWPERRIERLKQAGASTLFLNMERISELLGGCTNNHGGDRIDEGLFDSLRDM